MPFFHNSHVTGAVLRLQRTNSCERLAFASGACRGGRSRPMIFSLRVVRLLLIRRCRPVGWKASRSRICNLASVSSSSSEAHSAEHEVKSPSEGGSTSFSSSASMFANGARAGPLCFSGNKSWRHRWMHMHVAREGKYHKRYFFLCRQGHH